MVPRASTPQASGWSPTISSPSNRGVRCLSQTFALNEGGSAVPACVPSTRKAGAGAGHHDTGDPVPAGGREADAVQIDHERLGDAIGSSTEQNGPRRGPSGLGGRPCRRFSRPPWQPGLARAGERDTRPMSCKEETNAEQAESGNQAVHRNISRPGSRRKSTLLREDTGFARPAILSGPTP